MSQVDLGVFDRQKSLIDQVRLQQDYDDRRKLLATQLLTGGLDAQTKANNYKTQILSAAAAGGQDAFDKARSQLQNMGFDTTEYAPYLPTAANQLQAARLAQSPLGSLINTAQKQQSNDIALSALTGNVVPGALAPSIPGLNFNVGSQPVAAPVAAPAASPMASPVIAPAPPAAAIVAQPANQGSIVIPTKPVLPADMSTPAGPITGAIDAGEIPNPQPSPAAVASLPTFQPPAQRSNETNAAYQARVNTALDTFKTSPDFIASSERLKTKAGAEGKDQGAAPGEAANSQEITDRLVQNLQALKDLNPAVPDSAGLGPETKSLISKRMGNFPLIGDDGAAAGALAQWHQIDQQQILSDLAQLVKSGAVRSNRTIAQMLQTGSGIPADLPVKARQDLIDNLLGEVLNKNTTIQNVNARLNGGTVQPYGAILSPNNSAITAPPKLGDIHGNFFYNGGDPADPNSWKKMR